MQLYGRRASLKVGIPGVDGVLINDSEFRFVFECVKTSTSDPNTLKVDIFNLSKASREKVRKKDMIVVLEAGYKNLTEVLFRGNITDVWSQRQGVDTILKIECGDGVKAIRDSRSSISVKPGASVKSVIESAVTDLKKNGISVDGISVALQRVTEGIANGMSFSGSTKNLLDKSTQAAGIEWSIQDNTIQFLKRGNGLSNENAIILSKDSGLIGSPAKHVGSKDSVSNSEDNWTGWEVTSLLIPGIRPGRKIRLASVAVNGDFACRRVTFNGDTRGQAWTAKSEVVSL